MTTPKLSATTKAQIGRLALERTRPALWQETAQMRALALDKLTAGQSEGSVTAWLQALLGEALQAHAKGKY